MITEDYVSFEIAKLLKEKGFENDATSCINVFKGHIYKIQDRVIDADDDVTIPTLQMAMKWLREKHNLSITVFLLNVVDGEYIGYHADIELMAEWIENLNKFKKVSLSKTFHSYEQACESAIKYCLENLI